MPQIFNNPAEFATALHEGRITECLETIDTLDAQLEGDSPSPKKSRSSHNQSKSESPLARHTRKCSICKHPDREAIEDDFINWRSEETICYEFSLSSRSSIYRHAAATGLLKRRRLNLRGVCERIIERAEEAPPSAAAILRALRIFAHITEDGEWREPPKRSTVTHIVVNQDATAAANHEPTASECHPEPGRPSVANVGEGPAVRPLHQNRPPSSDPPTHPSAETVGAALRRQPSATITDAAAPTSRRTEATSVAQASACVPSSPASDEPSTFRPPETSEIPSSELFSETITDNSGQHNNLPGYLAPEILIGTQNHSPGDSTT